MQASCFHTAIVRSRRLVWRMSGTKLIPGAMKAGWTAICLICRRIVMPTAPTPSTTNPPISSMDTKNLRVLVCCQGTIKISKLTPKNMLPAFWLIRLTTSASNTWVSNLINGFKLMRERLLSLEFTMPNLPHKIILWWIIFGSHKLSTSFHHQ